MTRSTQFSAALASTAVVLATLGFNVSADSAVKACTARLTSIAAQDATEQGAKKKALDDWMLKAKGAGIAYPTWRLAAEKRLICQALPGGAAGAKTLFEWIAVGHACSVSQVQPKPNPRPVRNPVRRGGLET